MDSHFSLVPFFIYFVDGIIVATQLFIFSVSSSQYFEFHFTFYLCLVTIMSYGV